MLAQEWPWPAQLHPYPHRKYLRTVVKGKQAAKKGGRKATHFEVRGGASEL